MVHNYFVDQNMKELQWSFHEIMKNNQLLAILKNLVKIRLELLTDSDCKMP